MATIHKIDTKKLKDWLEKDEAILIDVREPGEHKAMNITGAVNLPLSKICLKEVLELAGNENKKIVFHCQAGKRSDMACKKIIKENPEFDIYDLEGGIDAWKDAEFEVNKDGYMIPLNRQVQCFASFFIILGYIIPNLIGDILILMTAVGLGIAGITGNCLLMPMVAKMPWNQVGKKDDKNKDSNKKEVADKKPSCCS